MIRIWDEIKKAFRSALSKWVGGAVLGILLFILATGAKKAKDVYNAPKEIVELKKRNQEDHNILFNNDVKQAANQGVMVSKIDSLIEVQKYKNFKDSIFQEKMMDGLDEVIRQQSEIRQQLYKK